VSDLMTDEECFDYLDAMYNDGYNYGTLIEDHCDPYGVPMDGLAEGTRGQMRYAHYISKAIEETWGEIEMLPECNHEEGRLRP
jgi:hypothetical protein